VLVAGGANPGVLRQHPAAAAPRHGGSFFEREFVAVPLPDRVRAAMLRRLPNRFGPAARDFRDAHQPFPPRRDLPDSRDEAHPNASLALLTSRPDVAALPVGTAALTRRRTTRRPEKCHHEEHSQQCTPRQEQPRPQ
jgi:hypothetical protein